LFGALKSTVTSPNEDTSRWHCYVAADANS
jgi:hypothetical protein